MFFKIHPIKIHTSQNPPDQNPPDQNKPEFFFRNQKCFLMNFVILKNVICLNNYWYKKKVNISEKIILK